MRIAVDIDEVLADTIEQIVAFYNANYFPEVVADTLEGEYLGFLGDTTEEANRKYFQFLKSEYAKNILPVEGSVEAIEEISKKADLIIVTGRPLFNIEETRLWIEKYFPGKFKEIIFNNDRKDPSNVTAYWGQSKSEICDEYGAGILIDDLPKFMESSDHLRVYLFDQPWNRRGFPDHATRVCGWAELVEKIKAES